MPVFISLSSDDPTVNKANFENSDMISEVVKCSRLVRNLSTTRIVLRKAKSEVKTSLTAKSIATNTIACVGLCGVGDFLAQVRFSAKFTVKFLGLGKLQPVQKRFYCFSVWLWFEENFSHGIVSGIYGAMVRVVVSLSSKKLRLSVE